MQVCDNKYTFLVTTHCPRAHTPVALRSSSRLRRRTRHKHSRTCRTPAAREGEEEGQEDQVDGANEHQSCRSAHRQLQLEYPRLSEPGWFSGGAYKHLLHLRLVLLLVVLVPLRQVPRSLGFFPPPFFPCQPHNAINHTTKHARNRTINFSAQRPDRTVCCARWRVGVARPSRGGHEQ